VDNLADHMEAVLDTGRDIQNSLAVVADNQVAVEDSQDILGNQQVAVAADNSCKGCNLLAMVEQWDTAYWLELLDMVPTVLYCTHTCTHTTHVREPGTLIILVKTTVHITILWQSIADTNTNTAFEKYCQYQYKYFCVVTIHCTVYYIQQCSMLFQGQ